MNRYISFFILFFGLIWINLDAQSPLEVRGIDYIESHQQSLSIDPNILANYQLTDLYYSASTELSHLYFQQTFKNVPIENAQIQLHINQEGQVVHDHSQFYHDLEKRIKVTSKNTIDFRTALNIEFDQNSNIRHKASFEKVIKKSEYKYSILAKSISNDNIIVQLLFHPLPDGSLQLSWLVSYNPINSHKLWETYIDAITGEVLSRKDQTIKCSLHNEGGRKFPNQNSKNHSAQIKEPYNTQKVDNSSYLVFPFPAENPLETDPVLVNEPSSPDASPFGWHDTDGEDGPEFTITRGNNVHAYIDRNSDNMPDGAEPEGGANLQFNFPFNLEGEPNTYEDAATTQLFYSLNWLHDFAFHYGFDEAVNFQAKNYSGMGSGDDPVVGSVFYGEDSDQFNNAFFLPTSDGSPASMRANLWSQSNDLLEIKSPASIVGQYETGDASFGPTFAQFPVEGEVVLYVDDSNRPNQACFEAINGDALNGKIALIDRGECNFDLKVANAEKAGAIACIICNYENVPVGMGSGTPGLENPGISAISLSTSHCAMIKSVLDQGVQIRIGNQETSGPMLLYSGLDNGVVAHEYAHGISHRLIGGPATTSCLRNVDYNDDDREDDGEQMGEGWSDFITMATTVNAGDNGSMKRTIGNYILRQDKNGRGVRAYPYSTDMNISPYTYEDAWSASVPHGVGAVWAAYLWDIYWGFVELYGFDEDLFNGNKGNNKAIQLIMDGMKLTPCRPGFIDGRDALLIADEILNGSAHHCLIWEMSAKRGLGYLAEQGDPMVNADGKASFDNLPPCIDGLKVSKSSTPTVHAGDIIDYQIEVVNHLDASASNVVIEDLLANGLEIVTGSNSMPFSQNGRNLTFEIEGISQNDTVMISYQAIVPADLYSLQLTYDDMENGDNNWDFINQEGTGIWELDNTFANSGQFAWAVPNDPEENDQILEWNQPIRVNGVLPAIRFYHLLDVQHGFDGGILELSSDGGNNWEPLPSSAFLRNGYTGPLRYDALSMPNIRGFYGKSEVFIPTYVDLSEYNESTIRVRFRFGSNNFVGNLGWFIDDFEVMELKRFKTQVCVSADGIPSTCTVVTNEGTFVESDLATSIAESNPIREFSIFPNPSSNEVIVRWSGIKDGREGIIRVYNNQGQIISLHQVAPNQKQIKINNEFWNAGIYWVSIQSDQKVFTEKLIKN